MNSYVTIDGYRYRVRLDGYDKALNVDRTLERGAYNDLLVTYGDAKRSWIFPIRLEASAGAGWGTISTLEATLAKCTPPANRLTLIDHDGTSYTVVVRNTKGSGRPMRPAADLMWYDVALEEA